MATNTHQIRTNISTTGSATLGTSLAVGTSATIGTTLTVTGASTMAAVSASSLSVSGASVLTGGITGGVAVTGNSSFANNVTITGDLTVNGSFSFAGGSVFPDNTFAVQDNVDATKQVMMDVTGASTGTISTLTFAQTASRAITFPDADMTVVGTILSQTLTNKTIDADSNTISNIDNADIKAGANIDRTKTAAGTADHVLINDGSGVMSSEAQLTPLRGGTGQDFSASTGVLKVAAGTVIATTVVNADVDAAAAIDRSKIAVGTANHVVINSAGGALSSEASLAESRGGTAQSTYTAGDILYSPSTNTLAKLAAGAPGSTLKISGGLPVWETRNNPSAEMDISDHFYGGTSGGLGWQSHSGGAGAGVSGASAGVAAGRPGVLRLITGSTSTGRGGIGLSVSSSAMINGHILTASPLTVEFILALPSLSTGSEEFVVTVGAYSHSTNDVQPNGTYFQYNRAGEGTNWKCKTANTGTITTTDSGVAVSTSFVRLTIVSDTANVYFYINGTLVATNTTNIPTAVITPAVKIQKTVGTSNSSLDVDAFYAYQRY